MQSNRPNLNESLQKIAKGAGFILMGTLTGRAFGYGSRIIIARFLGAADYGLILLGFAALTVATALAAIGLPAAVTRYVSFYKGKDDNGRIKGTVLSAIKINFPISVIFALLLFLCAGWISTHIFHDANLIPVLEVFSLAPPFLVLAQNLLSATVGFQDMRYQVYTQQIFQEVFKFSAIVILFVFGFGVIGAAWGWVLAIVLMPLLAFYFLQKRVFPIFTMKIKAIPVERELLSFSWPLIFVSISGIIMGFTDTLMLGYFCTSYEVGLYNMVLPTAMLIRIPLDAFGTISMPVITELYSRGRNEDLRDTYSAVTKWILFLAFPAFLLMSLFAQDIIKILFGNEYVIGARALSILAFGFIVSASLGPATNIINAFGKTKIGMKCCLAGSAVNLCLNFYLIPVFGINGAAIATAASLIFTGLVYFISGCYISKMQPFKLNHLRPVFSAIVAVLIVYSTAKYVIGVSLFVLLAISLVFLPLYFFLLLLFKAFDQSDLIVMSAIDKRLGINFGWMRKIIRKFL